MVVKHWKFKLGDQDLDGERFVRLSDYDAMVGNALEIKSRLDAANERISSFQSGGTMLALALARVFQEETHAPEYVLEALDEWKKAYCNDETSLSVSPDGALLGCWKQGFPEL